MKIHFCDLCNESVPQTDIDEGRAIERKGRVICMSCDRAMSHASGGESPESSGHPSTASTESRALSSADSASVSAPSVPALPAAPAARSGSSAGLWVAILALLFTAVAIGVLHRNMESLTAENARHEAALTESSRTVRSLMNRIEAADQRRGAQLDKVESTMSAVRQVLDADRDQARAQSTARGREMAALSQALAELRAELVAWREDSDRRIASHDAHLGRADDELRLLTERFAAIETGPTLDADPTAAAGSNGGGVRAWSGLLVDLASPNAGIRWQAVVGLGDTKDPEVVPSLLPMLTDKDVFVRMACARVLGDMGQNAAVPGLIDALEDAEAPVREAASIALRTVTGKDLRFDPLGNEADRAKKVKAWREWWKKLQEEPESVPG
jgi:HEAT repeat protein